MKPNRITLLCVCNDYRSIFNKSDSLIFLLQLKIFLLKTSIQFINLLKLDLNYFLRLFNRKITLTNT